MAEKIGDILTQEGIASATESARAAQWWLLLAVMVANKPADVSERKLIKFLATGEIPATPFEVLHGMIGAGVLRARLEQVKSGQYNRIERAFRAIDKWSESFPDPRTWTLGGLEGIPGIGPKTARWFYLLVNPKAQVAALDTHILKFLRDQGDPSVPKNTPPKGNVYKTLEAKFLQWADKLGLQPRDMDFMVWTVYRNKGRITF